MELRSRLLHAPGVGLAALLIAIVVAFAYLPGLSGSFQFDDWNVIVNEPRVHSLSAWWDSMPGIRPLTKFTYALNHELGGGVAAFRAFNVLAHFLCALLVFQLFSAVASRMNWSGPESGWSALWVALVFAAHPVQTEAVTYISGRSGCLAALCALASMVLWLKSRSSVPSLLRWTLPSLLLFGLAMMAKEMAIVLPLALGLLAITREDWRSTGPYWLLSAAAIAVVLSWPPYRHLIDASLGIRSIGANLLTQANASGFLLHELWSLWDLNADPQLPVVTIVTALAALRAILIACVAIAGILLWRRGHAWAIGLLWTLIWLAPTNSLLARLEVANDRQWYLALPGPAWMLACWGRTIAMRGDKITRLTLAAVGLSVVALLTTTTIGRNRVYDTEVSYWLDVVQKSPRNARAANNLGYALALQCRLPEAELQFRRALQLDPAYTQAGVNLRLLQQGALGPESRPGCNR